MKLCCLVNPDIVCEACGMHWCNGCLDPDSWSDKEFSHHKIIREYDHNSGWACPVAGEVIIRTSFRGGRVWYSEGPTCLIPRVATLGLQMKNEKGH